MNKKMKNTGIEIAELLEKRAMEFKAIVKTYQRAIAYAAELAPLMKQSVMAKDGGFVAPITELQREKLYFVMEVCAQAQKHEE